MLNTPLHESMAATGFGAAKLIPIMDQRTDSERRPDTAPNREARPAIAQAPKPQAWVDRMRKRRRMVLVVTALIIAAIVAVVVWWINTSGYESTDDAFIDARTVSISSQINAAIVDVPVTDNQLVEAGAVLVRLDDRDYKAQARSGQCTGRPGGSQYRQHRRPDRRPAVTHRRRPTSKPQQAHASLTFAQQQERTLSAAGEERRNHRSSRRSNTLPVFCKPKRHTPPPRPTRLPPKSNSRCSRRSAHSTRHSWSKHAPRRNKRRPTCRAPSSPHLSPGGSQG